MTRAGKQLAVCLLAVMALYAFHVSLKLAKITAHPTWDATDDTGQFWSEFAFHYRFAKFFAAQPISQWDQLTRDRAVQHPASVNDWEEFTIAMEVPAGALYRGIAPAIPFHVWVVWYACLVSSLGLFAVFFLARAVWCSDAAGLAASFLYATLYPGYGRTVKNLFLREDFAIPLIITALALTVLVLRRPAESETRRRAWLLPGAAGLAWLAALVSWHLTQFVLAVWVGAMVLLWIAGKLPVSSTKLMWLVATLLVGSLVLPILQAKQFAVSPVMAALYGVVLAEWVDGSRRKRFGVFAATVVAAVATGAFLGKTVGEYAHVYELFFYKLRFLGVKPADPSALPWEARSLWEGAFSTAPGREWWHSLQWCGPLALAALAFQRQDAGGGLKVIVVFTLLLVPLSWMVVRYFSFLGFAAAVIAAGMAGPALADHRQRLGAGLVIGAVAWQFMGLDHEPLERLQPAPQEYRPVVQWIEQHTATNAVILAHITESPVFWAHTGRPIIMHPKFENRDIRERYRRMLAAIYGSEEDFYAFCRAYEAAYFIYDISYLYAGLDSRRYKADRLGALPADCAARRFAEQPDRLSRFRLEAVFGRFAIFRVTT